MKTPYSSKNMRMKKQAQRGAALVVALVVLAVVTVIGVTSMQSSNTELKLAASLRDREFAFQAAEAALAEISSGLFANPPSSSVLIEDCPGSDGTYSCFNRTCDGGLCFAGSFESMDDQIYCEATDASALQRSVEFWSDSSLAVWKDANKHQTIAIDGVTTPVKYITEFRCFVPKHEQTPFSTKDGQRNNGAPTYRVTVVAKGNGNRSTIALQSTYTLF